MTNTGLYLFK